MAAPYNLAPNSQWEICSGLSYDTRYLANGTGQMPTANVLSYTVNTNKPIITVGSIPTDLKVGDCVKLSGGTAQQVMKDYVMRITAINTVAKTITVLLPRNLQPTASGTSTLAAVNIGCNAGSVGTGDSADGWKKHTSTICWREDNPGNLAGGSNYAMAFKKGISGQEYMYTEIDARRYRGAQLVFGVAIFQSIRSGSGTWQAYFNSDGTGGGVQLSAAASTTAGYQWLELAYHVPQDATFIQAGAYFNGALNDVYYAANPVLTIGTTIGSFNYVKPREDAFIPLVKVEPAPYINASITFPSSGAIPGLGYYYDEDMHAATGMQVAPTVKVLKGNQEGINTNAVQTGTGGSRLIAWSDKSADPIKLGNFLPQYATNVKSFSPARIVLDGNGKCVAVDGIASDSWTNVSIDFDEFVLS